MKAKPLIFVVSHGGYPFDVMVSLGAADDEILRALKRKGVVPEAGEVMWSDAETEQGSCTMLKNGATVIRLRNWNFSANDVGRLAHEISHAVEQMMSRMGGFERDCHCFAYAVQHLTSVIYHEIGKKGKRRVR